MVNFDDFKCRCSAISKILSQSRSNPCITEKQIEELAELEKKGKITDKQKERIAELQQKRDNGKKVVLSDLCIEYLMEWYALETEGMIPINKESLDILSLNKGKLVEEESGLLLSKVDGVIYKRHIDGETGDRLRIYNDFLSGELDWYLGESVYEAYNVTDTKNSFDYPTFLKKINKGVESGQKEQVQGYCDITGSPEGYVANTLLTCPPEIVEDLRWRAAKKMNATTIESPEFLREFAKWERSMNFEHIPLHKRVSKVKVDPFSDFERQQLYDRVKHCRQWLWDFHEKYEKLNIETVRIPDMIV